MDEVSRPLALFRFDNGLRRRRQDAAEQIHLTPQYLLGPVRTVLGGGIELDPCTTPQNPVGAERFYALPEDGAALTWSAATVFCNPPYGEVRARWVRRCAEALASATSVLFIQGRVKFGIPRANGRQVAASHPSALIGWNVDLRQVAHLGTACVLDNPSPSNQVDMPLSL